MKFGDTLYQRSVPKWAAYNLNYNELKHLIKLRTTSGAPSPLPIPGQTDHRWSLLEDELYGILKEQYDNIALFLRSKHGEIERRLTHLDKSVSSAKRSAIVYSGRPSLLARKFQKLVQEAESIGEDIQSLSRFAGVQKTAFRKILKKYHKWTNSDTLRRRLDIEVFSDGQLELDLADQMQHLSAQTSVIKGLQSNLLQPVGDTNGRRSSNFHAESPVSQIGRAAQNGPLHFDAAFASTPFGEASGTATYWIHPDNLAEARVLLLRYTRELDVKALLSRENSAESVSSMNGAATNTTTLSNIYFFDNGQRFTQDTTENSPSKVALSARWSGAKDALVTMSDMSPRSDGKSTVSIRRKELAATLDRNSSTPEEKSASAANVRIVKDFLSLHRDVKALAMLRSDRARYLGLNNSSEVGTFAILDTNITTAPFDKNQAAAVNTEVLNSKDFPYAVLEIRWEFGRKPEIVRAFNTTHLAEHVEDFSLEAAAIGIQNPGLGNLPWATKLEKDIRKVPLQVRTAKRNEVATGSTSGPSSADGPSESVFSVAMSHTTAGSETSPVTSMRDLTMQEASGKPKSKEKRARIAAESPERPSARYYSEYDDPDSEMYQQEVYTIFVDPNEEALGMATMRKIGNAISSPFSWLRKGQNNAVREAGERTSLLNGDHDTTADEGLSSESDIEQPGFPKYNGLRGHVRPAERYRRRLSRRQRTFERTLITFYSGLIILSYIFLLMSTILLATGRKKEVFQVDVGATVGVVMALLCMLLSCVLVYMRRERLTTVEKVSLILADGMIIMLAAGVVVGIVQRASQSKWPAPMTFGV